MYWLRKHLPQRQDWPLNIDVDIDKIIEVDAPERMLNASLKTAMLTVATCTDYYRVGEKWQQLQAWQSWKHGKAVNEVVHMGEYATIKSDVLTVCAANSDDVVCQVLVTDIHMVDCAQLTLQDIHELGYKDHDEFFAGWNESNDHANRGWYLSIMLLESPLRQGIQ